jgi:sarcosine oxidase, subunit beta
MTIPNDADVIIVGGGVMGLSIALETARRGKRVKLFEKTYVGAGASGRSGAILRQHYSNPLTVAMARDGLRTYANFEKWAGGPCGFRQVGCLILADAQDRAALEGNVRLMQEAGCRAELLTPPQIRNVAPMLSASDDVLGAWEPEAGYCDPPTTLNTLCEACVSAGVQVETETTVTRLRTDAGGRRVTGVESTWDAPGGMESWGADAVVLATGPWTNELLAPLSLSVPIQTTRPLLAFFARPLSLTDHPVVGDLTGGIYFRPDESRTLVGALDLSHDDPVPNPDALDETVPTEFIAFCRERVTARMEALRWGYGRGGYAGMYDCTPDMHPVLGAMPGIEGLYVAAGFSGHGFKLAPVIGRAFGELLATGDYETLDLSPLAPTRYEDGKPIRAAYEYGLLA